MPRTPEAARRRQLRSVALCLGGTSLVGAAMLGGSVAFVRATAAGHLFSEAEVPASPVALVLGARVAPDGTPSTFLSARLELAKRLYLAAKVKVILVSGDNMAPEYNEPEAMRTYLISAGIPPEKVIADYAGFDTYDSCSRARRIFGLSDLIVVTQSYHVPRAVATCLRLGLRASGVGDDSCRQLRYAWWRGAIRDQLACVKTVMDLATHRDPTLGPPDPSVDEALAR